MGKIVIKKRVSLDFLGEDYKEAYINFKSIPALDYEQIQEDTKKLEEGDKNSLTYIIGVLKKYFLDGKFPVESTLVSLSAEDLSDIDADTTIQCFQTLIGQKIDPKVESPLTTPSSTDTTTTQ